MPGGRVPARGPRRGRRAVAQRLRRALLHRARRVRRCPCVPLSAAYAHGFLAGSTASPSKRLLMQGGRLCCSLLVCTAKSPCSDAAASQRQCRAGTAVPAFAGCLAPHVPGCAQPGGGVQALAARVGRGPAGGGAAGGPAAAALVAGAVGGAGRSQPAQVPGAPAAAGLRRRARRAAGAQPAAPRGARPAHRACARRVPGDFPLRGQCPACCRVCCVALVPWMRPCEARWVLKCSALRQDISSRLQHTPACHLYMFSP